MQFLLSFPLAITAAIFSFFVFLYYLIFLPQKNSKRNNGQNQIAPQVAGAWPIIGHLHLLCGPQPPHITMGTLADKYGPIFSIKLGVYQAFFVSDSKLARECLTTNDKALASRPKSLAAEVMGYNYAMVGLGPYGAYWRQVRKILVLEFLSNCRLKMHAHVRVSEIRSCMKDLYEYWTKNKNSSNMVKFDMKECFGNLILNIVVRMLVGKQNLSKEKEGVSFRKAIKMFFDLVGTFILSDAVPYLKWLDLGGYEKVMRKTAKEMDDILEVWLREHKRRRNSGLVLKGEQQDFMDAMLGHVDGAPPEDFPGFDGDTVNKAACLTLLSGGTDTASVTLTWALSLLLNNPHTFQKAQDELDIHVGRDRQVQESDMEKLIYLQAIIKETLRLYPAGPLGLPHEATEDCVVGGYNIPKGARVFMNLWKIQRDAKVWSDANEFKPERFLMSYKDVDFRGKHFELIPFGSGRRICPGMSFGLQAVRLILASLIHGFEFKTPSDEPIDMSESIGLTNLKATPLEILLSPRLASNVYG